jgi:hypothetical protein
MFDFNQKQGKTEMNTKVLLRSAVALALVVFWAGSVAADVITYYPGGNATVFESPAVADGVSTTRLINWQIRSGSSSQTTVYNPTSADIPGAAGNGLLPAPADGSQCLRNTGTGLNVLSGNAARLDAGGSWIFYDGDESEYVFTAAVGIPLSGYNGQQLYMGIYEYNNAPGGSNGWNTQVYVPIDISGITPGTFRDFSVAFYTDNYPLLGGLGQSNMRMVLAMQGNLYVDGTYVTEYTDTPAPAPEPSTLVLLASGLIGLAAYAWRKRKS